MGSFIDRTGEKSRSISGLSLEVVACRSCRDIDVLVDGKYLREGMSYGNFVRGVIAAYPKNKTHQKTRLGEENFNKQGSKLRIIAYRTATDIDVSVGYSYIARSVTYNSFKLGVIFDPFHRGVCGVGYIGVGPYLASSNDKLTQQYQVWSSMLKRCYSDVYLKRNPSYMVCTVCAAWLNFQEFAKWYDLNFYRLDSEEINLDKDILVKGNKVYSPETCIFTPERINFLFINVTGKQGNLPRGVGMDGKKFRARLSIKVGNKTVRKFLGNHTTPELAFAAYKTAKEAYIKKVADEYKDKIPQKLYDALYAYKIEITD